MATKESSGDLIYSGAWQFILLQFAAILVATWVLTVSQVPSRPGGLFIAGVLQLLSFLGVNKVLKGVRQYVDRSQTDQ